MGMEISETGRQGQRVKQGGDRDEQRSVRGEMEIGQSQIGGGVVEKGWSGTDFVRDPLVIQYLTPVDLFILWFSPLPACVIV